jgi:hypothetical protein
MIRTGLTTLMILAIASCHSPLFAQDSPAREPTDLKVELRSATGSNRFQLGEVIPLEVLISSSTAKRYIEPCDMFAEGCFGFPRCRFFTHWSFDVIPNTGWRDVGWHGCQTASGPSFDVESSDLTAEPKKYTYTLTNRFAFDTPGNYTVRLSLTFGLDDETNQIRNSPNTTVKPNSVSKTAEMVLEIAPAGDEWKRAVIAHGLAAWTSQPPASTNPPSAEFLKYQQEKDALCNLGTPEAAVALANLLSQGIDVTHCLRINSHKDVAEAEMGRLLVDPNVGVRAVFFAAYAKLLSRSEEKGDEISGVTPKVVDQVRATLFASLSKKTPEAMVQSLETVLMFPMSGYWVIPGSVYDLRAPYSPAVIAMAAANFDRLPENTQAALLDTNWDHLRSPLMLPVVRRMAEAGDGHALLRWLELDPAAATAFMRQEVVRPEPRFSSLYLRLPEKSLPGQERQIAANFVALNSPEELIRSATLLHRYTTRATLPIVLPFIDQHLTEWPCTVQIPVLAYLLKVSPAEAKPRVEQVVQKMRPPMYCPRGEFFPSLGFMQAGPVLDAMAARQVKEGTPLAADAAEYLGRYGSAAMKPVVGDQLSRWHKKYVDSGAQLRVGSQKYTQDDWQLYNLDSRLIGAFVNAHGWTLSPQDVDNLSKLIGKDEVERLACQFSCGGQISVGPSAGNFLIYGRVNDPVFPVEARIDYLMPEESIHYSINQYRCADLRALQQKLLQFPAGSSFSVAHTASLVDEVGNWPNISEFLKKHGYSFKN